MEDKKEIVLGYLKIKYELAFNKAMKEVWNDPETPALNEWITISNMIKELEAF